MYKSFDTKTSKNLVQTSQPTLQSLCVRATVDSQLSADQSSLDNERQLQGQPQHSTHCTELVNAVFNNNNQLDSTFYRHK
jgi:hypothetical protein